MILLSTKEILGAINGFPFNPFTKITMAEIIMSIIDINIGKQTMAV